MAVLAFGGFELGVYPDGFGQTGSGTEIQSGARTGGRGARYYQATGLAAAGPGQVTFAATAQGNWVHLGAWWYFDWTTFGGSNAGSGTVCVLRTSAGKQVVRLDLNAGDGKLNFLGPVNSPNLTSAGPPPLQQWTYIAVRARINAGGASADGDAQVDGSTVATFTNSTAQNFGAETMDRAEIATSTMPFSAAVTPGGTNLSRIDDWVAQDSTGGARDSWPDPTSTVTCLRPVADSARGTNWVAGGGGTTNLWDAIDNTPPVGLSTATNTSQVRNSAKDTTGLYDVAVEAYNVAVASKGGAVLATDKVDAVQALSVWGSGAASAMGFGLNSLSNPGPLTEATGATNAQAVINYATDASTWVTQRGPLSVGPSVTLGTRPVVRLRKNTSSTTALHSCAIGVNVLATPAAPTPPKGRGHAKKTLDPGDVSVFGQAVTRAATWCRRRSGVAVPRLWTPTRAV